MSSIPEPVDPSAHGSAGLMNPRADTPARGDGGHEVARHMPWAHRPVVDQVAGLVSEGHHVEGLGVAADVIGVAAVRADLAGVKDGFPRAAAFNVDDPAAALHVLPHKSGDHATRPASRVYLRRVVRCKTEAAPGLAGDPSRPQCPTEPARPSNLSRSCENAAESRTQHATRNAPTEVESAGQRTMAVRADVEGEGMPHVVDGQATRVPAGQSR